MEHSSDLFRIEKLCLHYCGLSVFDNNSFWYRIYSIAMIVIFVFAYNILVLVDVLQQDFEDALDSWISVIAYTMVGVNALIVIIKQRSIGIFLNEFQQKPFVDDFSKMFVTKWCKLKNRRVQKGCTSLSVLSQLTYSLSLRLIKTNSLDWKLNYGSISVINVTYSPNFEIVYVYQSFSVVFGSMCGVTITVLITSMLQFFSKQFTILKSVLATKNTDQIEQFARYHAQVLEMFKKSEDIFGGIILWMFIGTLGMNSVEIYRLSQLSPNDIRTLTGFVEALAISIQIFLICISSEQMEYEREKMTQAVYAVDFVGADLRLQKCVLVILQKAQAPCRIKVGKLIEVSLTTFAKIMRATYSAYAMLNRVTKQ